MPKKTPPPTRTTLRDGSRIERNYRKGEDGEIKPSGNWFWCAYNPDRSPKRKRVNLRTVDHGTALIKGNERALEYDLGTFDPWTQSGPQNGIMLHEAAPKFIEMQFEAGKSEATATSDRDYLKRLARFLPAGLPMSQIERRHVEAFLNERKPVPKSKQHLIAVGEERSTTTKERMLSAIRHFAGWAVSQGLLRADPTAGIKFSKTGTSRRDHITLDEERAILAEVEKSEARTRICRDWLRDWIIFGTHTGLRPGEQRKLKWSAVRLDERMIEIGKGHRVKTAKSRRTIPVQGPAFDILKRRYDRRESADDGPVFTGVEGRAVEPAALRKAIKKCKKGAGIEKNVVPYSLRHAFGTRAAEGGIPLYIIAKVMGTSVAMIEKHYAHFSPDSAAAHLQRLYGSNDEAAP